MPCESAYMAPSKREKEADRLYWLRREIEQEMPPNSDEYGSGCAGHPTHSIDADTRFICSHMEQVEKDGKLGDYSLEMQIWWRDHKEVDRKRRVEEQEEARNKKVVDDVMAKLSRTEVYMLGKYFSYWEDRWEDMK